jgi:uncharacterized membrane protein (UPF0182 family)
MFTVAYLIALAFAAVPLVVTLSRSRRAGIVAAQLHRIYRDCGYVAVVGFGIILLETTLKISLQHYWFSELGQQYRYWLALGLRAAIFAITLLAVGLFAGAILRTLCRPPFMALPRSAPWAAGFLVAAIIGFVATDLWTATLAYLGARPTGIEDPVFGRDVSFVPPSVFGTPD